MQCTTPSWFTAAATLIPPRTVRPLNCPNCYIEAIDLSDMLPLTILAIWSKSDTADEVQNVQGIGFSLFQRPGHYLLSLRWGATLAEILDMGLWRFIAS